MQRSTVKCPECGNDIWDVLRWKDVAECSNCLYQRPFHSKTRGTHQTPSQTKALERAKAYFQGWVTIGELTVETSMQDGLLFARIHTHENCLVDYGGHLMIGRRGGITVLGSYGFGIGQDDERCRHFAKMLGGRVRN